MKDAQSLDELIPEKYPHKKFTLCNIWMVMCLRTIWVLREGNGINGTLYPYPIHDTLTLIKPYCECDSHRCFPHLPLHFPYLFISPASPVLHCLSESVLESVSSHHPDTESDSNDSQKSPDTLSS